MNVRNSQSVRTLLAAAGLLVSAHSQALAENTLPLETAPTTDTTRDAGASLDLAKDHEANGRLFEAREILVSLTTDHGMLGLTDTQRVEASDLLAATNRKIKSLAPTDRSVLTAEFSLHAGDLVGAERHAEAVVKDPQASNGMAMRARKILETIGERRAEIAGTAPAMLDRATAALDSGDLGTCKTLVETLSKSGVTLDGGNADRLSRLQLAMFDLHNASSPSAGLLQPGVVRPRNPRENPPEPTPEPAPEPKPEPTAEPTPEPAPAPAPKPEVVTPAPEPVVVTPAPEPAPAPAPTADPIEQALRMQMQQLMAEADQAFNAGRYNDALSKYQQVRSTGSQYLSGDQIRMVDSRMAEARARMNTDVGTQNILEQSILTQQAIVQNARAEFSNYMEQSRAALASGDYEAARNMAASALLRLGQAKNFLSAGEYESLLQQQKDLLAQISIEADRARAAEAVKTANELAIARREAEATLEQTKRQRIDESIKRIRALQVEQNYGDALQQVDALLLIDPRNPTGLLLRDVLTDMLAYQRDSNARDQIQKSVANHSAETVEATILPRGIINYPPDWPNISRIRGTPLAFADTEENRRTLASLGKSAPARFEDNSLSDVIGYIAQISNTQIDPDWASLEAEGIDKDTPVTLNLSNVSIRTILDRVSEKVSIDPYDTSTGASWTISDGVVLFGSKKQINRNKALVIYDIKDLLIEVPNYTNAPEFDLNTVLQGTGGRGASQARSPFRDTGGAGQNDEDRPTIDERTDDLIRIITAHVDPNGWSNNGGDIGSIDKFQGNLIVNNTPRNHREIHGLLSKLREFRAMQINVEARFLLVSTGFFEEVGVDIDVYFNAKNNQVRTARATDRNIQASDFFDFQRGGLRRVLDSQQYAPDGSITPATGTDPTLNNAVQNVANPSPMSVVGAGQGSLGLAEQLIQGGFAGLVGPEAPALGIAGQFLDDIQVDFLIKATQADRRTVTLTAPRLTFTNGQTSNLIVATQRAFVSDLQPVTAEGAVGFDPTVGVVNEGVVLIVNGTISADRRYVTLDVSTSISKIDGFAQQEVNATAGNRIVGSGDVAGSFIQLPTVTVTRVSTTVTVPDQGTILLGGQRLVTDSEVETGVPVLSKLPILNRLFSNRISSREEQTLLILIKPTVLIQNEQEEGSFPGIGESIRAGFGG